MSSLKDKCFIEFKGKVTIKINNNGAVTCHKYKNLVVNGVRQAIPNLLSDLNTDYKVDRFKIGVGTTAPTVNDTSLESPVLISGSPFKLIGANFSYPTIYSVLYELVLTNAEGNGNMISEIGLFTNNDTMISRLVFSPIDKQATSSVTWEWEHSY